uniref:hypothetical protein n=1 Tax=Salmonella sp. s58079 TaxID=3159700 RepID=UPI00397FC387
QIVVYDHFEQVGGGEGDKIIINPANGSVHLPKNQTLHTVAEHKTTSRNCQQKLAFCYIVLPKKLYNLKLGE